MCIYTSIKNISKNVEKYRDDSAKKHSNKGRDGNDTKHVHKVGMIA